MAGSFEAPSSEDEEEDKEAEDKEECGSGDEWVRVQPGPDRADSAPAPRRGRELHGAAACAPMRRSSAPSPENDHRAPVEDDYDVATAIADYARARPMQWA